MTLKLIPGMLTAEETFGLTKERAEELSMCAADTSGDNVDEAHQRLIDECDNDNELVYAFMSRGIMLGMYIAETMQNDKDDLMKAVMHLN